MTEHALTCVAGVSECPGCADRDGLDSLASAVRAIAHGPASGPGGLEALAMSIAGAGDFDSNNLATAVRDGSDSIASALRAIADAIEARE